MSLTDENMVMPVAPYNGGNNGGFLGGDISWVIIFLFFAMFGGGFGGLGGWGGGMWGMDGMFPWLLASNQQTNGIVSSGFDNAATMSAINGVQNAVTSGFGDVQTALCGGFAGVNATVNGAQNAISQQLYTNQLADLERSYAAQTATLWQGAELAMLAVIVWADTAVMTPLTIWWTSLKNLWIKPPMSKQKKSSESS